MNGDENWERIVAAMALTIALGALIVSQVQLHEARGEVHRLRALLSDVTKWRQNWGRTE